MPSSKITPESLLEIHFVSDPQISPDGQQLIFTKSKVNEKNKYCPNLWLHDRKQNSSRQLTFGDKGNSHGRWSPDGQSIAFTSGREKPASQIYLLPMSGGEAKAITALDEGSIADFKFSPDGKHIAFKYRPTHQERTEKAAKEREEAGLSNPPWAVDNLWYRLDGDGYFGNQRYAIYLVDVETGEVNELYGASAIDWYSYDWLPDSRHLIVAHSACKQPLLEPANDQLFLVDLNGKAKRIKNLPKGSKSSPAVSPDGKSVAWLGNESQTDWWGCLNDRVFLTDLESGETRCLTNADNHDFGVATLTDTGAAGNPTLEWLPSGNALRVTIGQHGTTQIGEIDAKTGQVTALTQGQHVMAVGNLSQDGKVQAITFGTPTCPAEGGIYEDKVAILTSFNEAFKKKHSIADCEEVWIPSTDGTSVQAWVMKPKDFKPEKKYPAVLEVHGGPHTQYGLGFFHEFQCLVTAGYVVVFSNPRGSKGYGEKHCAAISGDWGNKDWDDIQALTNWMRKKDFINAKRIGIMGGSYGGYMTNWAIGHSSLYKAAITDRCVSNWVSAAGNSDFPLARQEYFGGYAWGDIEKIREMWRQSPISYFDKVKTPTLIIHSEGDLRCNVEQSDQVFHALQAQGVKSRYVRYPSNTSHGMSRNGPPDLRIHRLYEILNWWKDNL
ncbi:S9 family peptidase [Kamptonema cortianum]|nr:S9 family peptidase [Geitlerinema splendidum]MDK3162242.1 S9 family peptidase [Kamptonema cortianum]